MSDALGFALLSAAGNLLGAAAVARRAAASLRAIEQLVAFGAGFMLSVAIVEVLPEAFARSGTAAPALVLIGYLAVHLTQHTLTPHFHFGEETHTVPPVAGTSALVGLLLHDVTAQPGALPLLSHALLETWKRRRGRTLTLAGYAASGRVHGAIAKTAEDVLNQELTADQRSIARNIFVRLTELGEGVQDTRRRVALAELLPQSEEAETVEKVLKALVERRHLAGRTLPQETSG